ncbi:hypothetical protein [Blastococcus xanthinilyticus]|uniref:Uncharacterized protein n=1 Tax=Blastococcus xanthinilyticus TaxID=1564164 RepID=A0A5S5CMM9_9ACTN|nr:hypothetical protein [Blastococcus xanthinilyticus]TYP83655.1 hypothetical protein BD833_11613 [Blastococcus xanthinilyticus]
MTENRYAVPLEVLEAGVRVDAGDQVSEQPTAEIPPAGQVGPGPWTGSGAGDADGD